MSSLVRPPDRLGLIKRCMLKVAHELDASVLSSTVLAVVDQLNQAMDRVQQEQVLDYPLRGEVDHLHGLGARLRHQDRGRRRGPRPHQPGHRRAPGEVLTSFAAVGQRVERGQTLSEVDLELLGQSEKDPTTVLVVASTAALRGVVPVVAGTVAAGETVVDIHQLGPCGPGSQAVRPVPQNQQSSCRCETTAPPRED